MKESPVAVTAVYQLQGISAKAFALPLSGIPLFDDRVMNVLTDDELAAICPHEIG